MEYRLIATERCFELETQVLKAMSRGWRPSGSLVVNRDGYYCQPVSRTSLMRLWVRIRTLVTRSPFVVKRHDLTIQGSV